MAIWVCRNCTAKYAVGLFRCPQCRSENSFEEGSMSPKINRHGGSSDAAALIEANPSLGHSMSVQAVEDAMTEGGEPWAGTSSSTSSETEPSSDSSSSPPDPSPAPTTENPSPNPLTDPDSSADSTDGESETTDQSADQPDPYADWTKDALQAELVLRELPKSGKVADLVARLLENDAARASADETGE